MKDSASFQEKEYSFKRGIIPNQNPSRYFVDIDIWIQNLYGKAKD